MVNDREFLRFHEGSYKTYFEKYIELKRGKGEKVAHSTLVRLGNLNNALNNINCLEITSDIAEIILQPRVNENSASRQLRISDFRQFSAFLNTLGLSTYQLPYKYAKTSYTKFHPYIFNDDELIGITRAADNLSYGRRSHRHQKVYPILIRILIGTGMRIGEVLALTKGDIDISQGVIKVVNSKNRVSRYIPVSESLANALNIYTNEELDSLAPEVPLFTSPYTDKYYTYDAVKYMFPKLCTKAGIYTLDKKTPNIHSLRHTFCTKSLEQMLASGMSLYMALPILAAYVGHVNLSDTERYIHLTRSNHESFIQSESSLKQIIPEVVYDE